MARQKKRVRIKKGAPRTPKLREKKVVKEKRQKRTEAKKAPISPQINVEYPIKVFATYKKVKYEAIMKAINQVIIDGMTYSSLSMAASSITKSSVNGWKFWKFEESGITYSVNVIRGDVPLKVVRSKKPPEPVLRPVKRPVDDLPLRNSRSSCAEYYINERAYRQWGHISVFLYAMGPSNLKALVLLTFNKRGDVHSSTKLGEIASWSDCRPIIDKAVTENSFVRVKAVA